MPTSGLSSTLASPIDKGPYLNVSEDGMVSADDNNFMHSQANDESIGYDQALLPSKPSSVIPSQYQSATNEQPCAALEIHQSGHELKLAKGRQENAEKTDLEDSQLKHSNEEEGSIIQICIKGRTEFIALQSVLHQLLHQMQASSKDQTLLTSGSNFSQDNILSPSRATKELTDVNRSPSNPLALCGSGGGPYVNVETSSTTEQTFEQSVQKLRDNGSNVSFPITKSMMRISRQQRRSMWILAYIAIITTWPLVGSALMINAKRKFTSMWSARWLRK
eukprot:Gb_16502 [translate_table: standard]